MALEMKYLIIAASVFVVATIAILFFAWQKAASEAEEAAEEAERARQALSIATAYHSQVKEAWRETKEQAEEETRKAAEKIEWLESSIAQAREDLKKTEAEKEELQGEIEEGQITPPEDAPIEEVIDRALVLYPGASLEGLTLAANEKGRGLIQMLTVEVIGRRELDRKNEEIITRQQGQLIRTEEILAETRKQLQASEAIRQALEDVNEALQTENNEYVKLTGAQDRQIKALLKKSKFEILKKPEITIPAVLLALWAGSKL